MILRFANCRAVLEGKSLAKFTNEMLPEFASKLVGSSVEGFVS